MASRAVPLRFVVLVSVSRIVQNVHKSGALHRAAGVVRGIGAFCRTVIRLIRSTLKRWLMSWPCSSPHLASW